MAPQLRLIETPEYLAFRAELAATAGSVTRDKLGHDKSINGLFQTAQAVMKIIRLVNERLETMVDRLPPFACKAGCDRCCGGVVRSFPLFTLYAALFAKTQLPAEQFARIQQRTLAQRAPCPMLENGCCSIYLARLPVCHLFYSFDYTKCLADNYCDPSDSGFSSVNYDVAKHDLFWTILNAVKAAQQDAGLHSESQHLDSGLRILFSQPDVLERWLAGEDVFQAANYPPVAKP